MTMQGLMLHCGASAVSRGEVLAVPTPAPTDSHYPIPHAELLTHVDDVIRAGGYEVRQEGHGLTRDGQVYFGLLEIANGLGDRGTLIGVRNSHDKSCAASLACGTRVFVCDNMSFSGQVTLARKHTTYIMRDLPGLVSRAMGQLGDYRKLEALRYEQYNGTELTDQEAHDLMIRAAHARAVPGSQIVAVANEWKTPTFDDFKPRTAWSLFNAFTTVARGNAPATTLRRTQILHGLLDVHTGVDWNPQRDVIGTATDVSVDIAS